MKTGTESEEEDVGVDSAGLEKGLARLKRLMIWLAILFSIVGLYLFVLPVLVLQIESNDEIFDSDSVFYEAYMLVFWPMGYLYDNVPVYEEYINWLGETFAIG